MTIRAVLKVTTHHINQNPGERSDLSAPWTKNRIKKRSIHQYVSMFHSVFRPRSAKYGRSLIRSEPLLLKLGMVVVSIILLASCSKMRGSADNVGEPGGLSSRGLGQFSQFSGQEAGESYTTQAPHNQVYLFAYDDSTLAQKYVPSVDAQAEYLKSHPGARILLTGHTDERGSREYNIALGERRANTVADLMRLAGVNRQQIRVVSYGKERPVSFGHDEASYRQNRRVELIYEATR